MKALIKHTLAPLSSLLIIMLGLTYFNTFVSLRVSFEGYNSLIIGLLYASYYAGMMIGAFYMENIIKSTGHIRAFSLFASITALSIIFHSFTNSPYIWIPFRFTAGLGCAGLFIVIESWLLLLSSPITRGKVLSLYMISLYSAQSVSQFFLNSVPLDSFYPFNLTVVFCCLSIIPVCLMKANAPEIGEIQHINLFYILRKIPFGFIGNFIAGLIISSFWAFAPIFAKYNDYSTFKISLLMAVSIAGGMVFQWPIGHLSDIYERRKVMTITCLVISILSFVVFLKPAMPYPLLVTSLFFLMGCSFVLYPLSITYCCDFFLPTAITAVTCTALIIYGLGCILGPILTPLFIELIGTRGIFLFYALASTCTFVFGLWRSHKLPPTPGESKETFTTLIPITPKGLELDPRKDEPSPDDNYVGSEKGKSSLN